MKIVLRKGNDGKKGFIPVAHLFLGIVASLIILFLVAQWLGIFTNDDRIAIDSVKALSYMVSCSASTDGKVDVHYEDVFFRPKQLSTDTDVEPKCERPGESCNCGVERTFTLSKAVVGPDKDEGEYKISGYNLPQKTNSVEEALRWIGGYGDPRYVVYYNSFPEGEEKPWRFEAGEADPFLVGAVLVGGTMNALPFGIGKIAGKLGVKITTKIITDLIKRAIVASFKRGPLRLYKAAEKALGKKIGLKEANKIFSMKYATHTESKELANIEIKLNKVMNKNNYFKGSGVDDIYHQGIATRLSDDFAEGALIGETRDQTIKRLTREYTQGGYFDDLQKVLVNKGGSVEGGLKKLAKDMDNEGLLDPKRLLKAYEEVSDETAEVLQKRSFAVQQMEGLSDYNFELVMTGRVERHLFRDSFKLGLKKMEFKLQSIKNSMPGGEFKALTKRAGPIAEGLARSRVAWIAGLDSLADAEILPNEATYPVQCVLATPAFGKAGVINAAQICALALGVSIVAEQVDSMNKKYVPVGINQIALKVPYFRPREFTLDNDVMPFYVDLVKRDAQDIGGSPPPTRYFSASPCMMDYTTEKNKIGCMFSKCDLESVDYAECFFDGNDEPLVCLKASKTWKLQSDFDGVEDDIIEGKHYIYKGDTREEIDLSGKECGLKVSEVEVKGETSKLKIEAKGLESFIAKEKLEGCVNEVVMRDCGVVPQGKIADDVDFGGRLSSTKWLKVKGLKVEDSWIQVAHLDDPDGPGDTVTGDETGTKMCGNPELEDTWADFWGSGAPIFKEEQVIKVLSPPTGVSSKQVEGRESFCHAVYGAGDILLDVLVMAPFVAVDFLPGASLVSGFVYTYVDYEIEKLAKWPERSKSAGFLEAADEFFADPAKAATTIASFVSPPFWLLCRMTGWC